MKKLKRMVTDPTTGERTAILATNKSGRVEWKISKEIRDDKERARTKSAKKNQDLEWLRKAIQ